MKFSCAAKTFFLWVSVEVFLHVKRTRKFFLWTLPKKRCCVKRAHVLHSRKKPVKRLLSKNSRENLWLTPLVCHKILSGVPNKSQFFSYLETTHYASQTNYKFYGRCILYLMECLFHLTEPRPWKQKTKGNKHKREES